MDVERISVDGFNLNVSDAKARDMISDKYDPDNGTYVVGDTCINDDVLYICNTDIDTPEDFDSSKWDADTLGHYCSELKDKAIYYQDGETFIVSSSSILLSRVDSTKTSVQITIFTPKEIPNDCTITVNGSVGNIVQLDSYTDVVVSGITLGTPSHYGSNAIRQSLSFSRELSPLAGAWVVPNQEGLTYTFHRPT